MTTRSGLIRRFVIAAALCVSLAGCESKPPNFLVLIGDDMGVETISCYPVGSAPARTPHISDLCDAGLRFDNFWSQPVCSPTRATILTGQYGFRNGVGTPATGLPVEYPVPDVSATAVAEFADRNVGPDGRATGVGAGMGAGMGGGMGRLTVPEEDQDDPLNQRPSIRRDAYGLPAALAADLDLGYQTAAFGKWHLDNEANGGLDHPQVVGFDHYAGNYNGGAVESYFAWSKVVNGEITDGNSGYATTDTVNDVLEWLGTKDPDRPWLAWVAFNAPHSPYAPPPATLVSEETAAAMSDASAQEIYRAMIEAMDTEIGRLLDEIPADELANTYVIFLGDNGTPNPMATPPFQSGRVKGMVHQGGVNVPLVVSGPGISQGSTTGALANSVDLFATLLDLAGTAENVRLDSIRIDSVSLAPVLADPQASVRDFAYADVFGPQQGQIVNRRAIRGERYKIIRDLRHDVEEFYDLSSDPWELENLLDRPLTETEQQAYDTLAEKLEALVASH